MVCGVPRAALPLGFMVLIMVCGVPICFVFVVGIAVGAR